jgi:hypothetical protein
LPAHFLNKRLEVRFLWVAVGANLFLEIPFEVFLKRLAMKGQRPDFDFFPRKAGN